MKKLGQDAAEADAEENAEKSGSEDSGGSGGGEEKSSEDENPFAETVSYSSVSSFIQVGGEKKKRHKRVRLASKNNDTSLIQAVKIDSAGGITPIPAKSSSTSSSTQAGSTSVVQTGTKSKLTTT